VASPLRALCATLSIGRDPLGHYEEAHAECSGGIYDER